VVAQNPVAVLPAMCPRYTQRCNGNDRCNRESDLDEHHAIIPWRINWVKPERTPTIAAWPTARVPLWSRKVTPVWNEKSAGDATSCSATAAARVGGDGGSPGSQTVFLRRETRRADA
jgi:hypothetical protein